MALGLTQPLPSSLTTAPKQPSTFAPPPQTAASPNAQNIANQQANALTYYAGAAGLNPADYSAAQNYLTSMQWNNTNADVLRGTTNRASSIGQQQEQGNYLHSLAQLNSQNNEAGQQLGIYNSELGDYGKLLANQIQGFNQGADVSRRQLTSTATANGALQTGGTIQGFTDIGNQLANQISGAQTQNDLNQLGVKHRMTSYQNQLDSKSEMTQYLAKMYGLKTDELSNVLQQHLNQIGVDNIVSLGDLQSAFDKGSVTDKAAVMAVLNSAMQNSGGFSSAAPPPQPQPASTLTPYDRTWGGAASGTTTPTAPTVGSTAGHTRSGLQY